MVSDTDGLRRAWFIDAALYLASAGVSLALALTASIAIQREWAWMAVGPYALGALTAMALMFAIFKYRPSPFCLLDEIDAPLDDANIGRFVEMLQGMGEHTQFILITHNRKTMEIADRLYGVTMEEPGVSKLISVQLN